MPMNWNAETEAKLMAAIMTVFDVKPNGAQLEKVAKIMGPECTAKAISHRLTKYRQQAAKLETGDEDEKPKKTRAPAGKGKKRKARDEDEDGQAPTTPPPSDKKIKVKQEYDDQIKVGEDIGEGFRATPAEYDSGEEV